MITLFAVPKPFVGHIGRIQLNAVKSWRLLHPQIQIILLGSEAGIQEVVEKERVQHLSQLKKNRYGTPLLDDVFARAKKHARYRVLAYINNDIILLQDFIQTIRRIKLSQFLLTGRRYNLHTGEQLTFSPGWESRLKQRIKHESKLYRYGALDYFVFTRDINWHMPPLILGRTAWDNWIVYQARKLKIPVIDASSIITAIHQQHDFLPQTQQSKVWFERERQCNWQLIGDRRKFFNVKDADWLMKSNGLQRTPLTFTWALRRIEKLPVLNRRFGFIAESLIFFIRLVRFFRHKLKTFSFNE